MQVGISFFIGVIIHAVELHRVMLANLAVDNSVDEFVDNCPVDRITRG